MPFDLLVRVLAALEGYIRRRVIDALRRCPRVGGGDPSGDELTSAIPRAPAISQALAVLLRARLVQRRVQGRRHIYQLDRTGLDALRDYLEGLEGLSGFEA